jgi:hypothetical protein
MLLRILSAVRDPVWIPRGWVLAGATDGGFRVVVSMDASGGAPEASPITDPFDGENIGCVPPCGIGSPGIGKLPMI